MKKEREIKFRVYDPEHGLMDYFDLAKDFDFDYYRKTFKKKDFKIMQYTGLKDLMGKEIYEGDIVHWTTGSSTANSEIVWNKDFWGVGNGRHCDASLSEHRHILEVIGNIYENKYLLTSTKGE